MNIIERRDKQNIHRKRMKEKYDSVMELSVTTGNWVPLLSEGMITYGDGSPWFYIMRGALKDYYDNLPEDYEGSINIGHTDLATFPDRIVGRWTKRNLRLVDGEDGRQTLETNLPINMDHPLVEALREAEYDIGLSVEMSTEINWDLTENTELNPFGVPIVEHLFVYDYALVGNAGDVGSMGVHLKGELVMNERLKKLAAALEKEGGSKLSDLTKLLDEGLSEAETVEETSEETSEEVEEEEETAEETSEEESEEEASEEEVSEEEETPEEETELSETINSLVEELVALRQENADLKAELDSVKATLSAKETEEKAFMDKFKKLSVSLTTKTPKVEAPKSQYTDGIGE